MGGGCSQFFMGKLAEAHATFDETIRNYDRERDRGLVIKFAQDQASAAYASMRWRSG